MDGNTSQVPYWSCETLLNPPEMSLFVAMVTTGSSELRVSQFITCNDTLLVETYQLTRCRNRKKKAKKIAQHAYHCRVGTSETLMANMVKSTTSKKTFDIIYSFCGEANLKVLSTLRRKGKFLFVQIMCFISMTMEDYLYIKIYIVDTSI